MKVHIRGQGRRARRGLTAFFIVLLALWQTAAPVGAAVSGPYSVAYETSQSTGYTGLSVTRVDYNYSLPAQSGCTNAVYQTGWVFINASATAWVEQGTYDCPNGTDGYFHGFSTSNNFQWLADRPGWPTQGASHTFQIKRTGIPNYTWQYFVDGGSVPATVNWPVQGVYVSAGLESYIDTVLPAQYWSGLQSANVNVNSGAWVSWSGQDTQSIGPGPNMCGSWASATSWRAGEMTSC